MPDLHRHASPLAGRRVLVVEDAAVIASKVARLLGQAGGTVIGPIATLPAAFEVLERGEQIDAALVDVDLRGELAFPLCERLIERGIRFMFLTGYDVAALPPAWSKTMTIQKPFQSGDLLKAALSLISSPQPASVQTGKAPPEDPLERRLANAIRHSRNLIMESRILSEESAQVRAPPRAEG